MADHEVIEFIEVSKHEAALDAACRVEAEYDGRDYDTLGRVDKARYRERLWAAILAYKSEMGRYL